MRVSERLRAIADHLDAMKLEERDILAARVCRVTGHDVVQLSSTVWLNRGFPMPPPGGLRAQVKIGGVEFFTLLPTPTPLVCESCRREVAA